MADYKRQTARKCRISHLLNGNYVEQEGWEPNYVETGLGRISRVNILAVVVGKEGNSLLVDDGSGRMELRSFSELPLLNFNIGDRLLVIARPRFYNNALYLAAEIVRKVDNDKWLEHRKIEIELMPRVNVEKVVVETVEKVKKIKQELKTGDDVVERIKSLDNGDGVDVDDIIKEVSSGDKIISLLLQEGEIFEVKPGRVKVLD